MIKKKVIPKIFWIEVACTVYILNGCPTTNVPYHAWSRKKLVVSHLYVFRSIAYAHIYSANMVKLDDKALKCAFIC